MVTKPYQTIGFIGAMLGANLIIALSNKNLTLSAQNQIGEALSFLLLGSFLIDLLYAKSEKPMFLAIPFLAFFSGLIYQPFSYLVIFQFTLLTQILLEWIIYSLPVILFVGLPVMIVSEYFKSKNQALQLFIFSFLISIVMLSLFAMLHSTYILQATKMTGITL